MTEPTPQNIILYFEDEDDFREIARRKIENNFPTCKTVVQAGGREHGTAKSCVDEVLAQIESLNNVAIVCTDGNLAGDVTGWDVVEELNRRGYEGLAIYTGGSQISREKARLYVARTSKFGEDLICAIKQYLPT